MNNIIHMQKEILKLVPRNHELHKNPTNQYIDFNPESLTDLAEIATDVDEVLVYIPQESTKELLKSITLKKVQIVEDPKMLQDTHPIMIKIDAHMVDTQLDNEARILKSLRKVIDEHQPTLLIRCEDPDQGAALLKYLNGISYTCYYFYQLDEQNDVTINKIWMVAVSNKLDVGDIGQDIANHTGHPRDADLVKYVMVN